MNTIRTFTMLALVAGFTCLTACTNYYQVSDPATGKTYYTDKYDQKSSGAVTFTSMHTGEDVTIQNSAIKKVNEQQAKYGQTDSQASSATAAPKAEATKTPAAPAAPAAPATDDKK